MPANKNHHYVPQFLLRRFSADGRSVTLLLVDADRPVSGASIRDQCARPYFHGKDLALEKSFGQLEGNVNTSLGDLSDAHLSGLDDEELDELKQFVHFQHERTAQAANETADDFDLMMRSMFSQMPEARGLNVEDIRVQLLEPQLHSLFGAVSTIPAILDLEIAFLRAPRGAAFVLGDHPVAKYNAFVERHVLLRRFTSSHGMVCKGLQYFLPLSPRICLALFDSTSYSYGIRPECRTVRASATDVEEINTLIAVGAEHCIYFLPNETNRRSLNILCQKRQQLSGRTRPQMHEAGVVGKPNSKLLMFGRPSLRIAAKMSFARVIEQRTFSEWDRAMVPPRSWELLNKTRVWGEMIDRKVRRRSKSNLPDVNADD